MVAAEATDKADQPAEVSPAKKLNDTDSATDKPADESTGGSETAAVATSSCSAVEPPAPPKISKDSGSQIRVATDTDLAGYPAK